MDNSTIVIRGAREHNLRNVNLDLPRNRLIVFTGVSGSGKSSLAFDTLYAEGQRRYVESLSSYARQFLGQLQKPDVDYLAGLSPAISIQQKAAGRNPRSTVGTITEVYDYLRVLYARIGVGHCTKCGRPITAQSREQILANILALPEGTRFLVLAPVVRGDKETPGEDILLSARYACVHCQLSYEPPSPQLFSFNSPMGMCPDCDGLGTRYTFDPDLLIPDPELSLWTGAVPIVGPVRGMGR